jgi:hypothetical protein
MASVMDRLPFSKFVVGAQDIHVDDKCSLQSGILQPETPGFFIKKFRPSAYWPTSVVDGTSYSLSDSSDLRR